VFLLLGGSLAVFIVELEKLAEVLESAVLIALITLAVLELGITNNEINVIKNSKEKNVFMF